MTARVVRLDDLVISVGLDHHDGFYYLNILNQTLAPLGPPYIPVPGSWWAHLHFVETKATWYWLKDKSNSSVLADGVPVVSVDHTAEKTIHVPFGINVLLPVIFLLSETGWKLAVSSVVSQQGPLASTVAGPVGINVNCADPISMPCAAFGSPGTVHVSPSAADFALAVFEWAATEALNLAVQAGLGKLGKYAGRAIGNKVEKAISRTYIKERYLRDAARFLDRQGMRRFPTREGMEGFREQLGNVARTAAQKVVEKFAGDSAKDQLQDWGVGPGNLLPNAGRKLDER